MNTAYHPVPEKGNGITATTRVASGPGVFRPKPTKRRTGGLTLHIIGHIIGFLWLAPIVALLVLNFKQHIIGASVWCPSGKCDAESYAGAGKAIERAAKLDEHDRDVLGALQYVSKALEVWFMFVATGLVYDIALLFAKRWGGLPIGYLFTHLEFGDIRNLANPTLWTSPMPHGDLSPKKSSIYRLYMFAVFVAFLTVLTNFMGPSTAVLVLPTLQWVDTEKIPVQRFLTIDAGLRPRGNDVLPGCTDEDLLQRNYTCSGTVYGPALDSFHAAAASSIQQATLPWGALSILASSNEGLLSFQANVTHSGAALVWVPLRQTLRDLSLDDIELGKAVLPGLADNASFATTESQPNWNSSLETVLQRQGPSIGVQLGCYVGNYIEKYVDDNRWVLCYDGWYISQPYETNYTKCIRAGVGWSKTNSEAQFNLGDGADFQTQTTVYVYTSDKSVYYNQTTDFGSGIEECLQKESESCAWDSVFDTPMPEELRNGTLNVQIQVYYTPESKRRFWCDSVAYLSMPTYSVDTLLSVNPMYLVQLHDLPTASSFTPLAVHSDWWLAAWSVAYNGTVNRNRTISWNFGLKLRSFFDEDFDFGYMSPNQYEALYDHIYSIAQSISLISYQVDNSTEAIKMASTPNNPILHRFATLRVWAYGLSDRTSRLGVAVVLMGCLCVLARVALAAGLKIRHEHSTVELFVAALEHNHQGEFDDIEDEALLARVRYFVDDNDDDEHGGHRKRPTFVSEKMRSNSGSRSNSGLVGNNNNNNSAAQGRQGSSDHGGGYSPPESGHSMGYS